MTNFQLSEFTQTELSDCHLLQMDFLDVPFTELKYKIFLGDFKRMMDFIVSSDDITKFVMYFNFKDCTSIPVAQTPSFIELILSYQDMFEEKLICTQGYISSNFMTVISNIFCKLYKTVKPFLFLKKAELDVENIIHILKST